MLLPTHLQILQIINKKLGDFVQKTLNRHSWSVHPESRLYDSATMQLQADLLTIK